jgi:hypothetical protein
MSDTRLVCVSSTVLVVHGVIMKCSNQGIQMLLCIAGSRDDAAMVGARWSVSLCMQDGDKGHEVVKVRP